MRQTATATWNGSARAPILLPCAVLSYFPNRPKGTGQRYGEAASVIAFVAGKYRERYARIWNEFLELANASDLPSIAGAFDQMDVRFGDHSRSTLATESKSRASRTARRPQSPDSSIFDSQPTGSVCIRESDLRHGHLDWVGNDQSEGRQHGVVTMSESLDLRLSWRNSRGATPTLIGCYRLNLRTLVSLGYARLDRLAEPDRIRLQFVHECDDGIYIRVKKDTPRLYVGYFRASSGGRSGGV